MIIVSQNKMTIYNFDNINSIFINSDNEIRIIDNNYIEGYYGDLLGLYKTEKRAKEVLQKLIQSYREYRTAEVDGYTNVLEETAVFEMPKE